VASCRRRPVHQQKSAPVLLPHPQVLGGCSCRGPEQHFHTTRFPNRRAWAPAASSSPSGLEGQHAGPASRGGPRRPGPGRAARGGSWCQLVAPQRPDAARQAAGRLSPAEAPVVVRRRALLLSASHFYPRGPLQAYLSEIQRQGGCAALLTSPAWLSSAASVSACWSGTAGRSAGGQQPRAGRAAGRRAAGAVRHRPAELFEVHDTIEEATAGVRAPAVAPGEPADTQTGAGCRICTGHRG
jgi:hypothetical protein